LAKKQAADIPAKPAPITNILFDKIDYLSVKGSKVKSYFEIKTIPIKIK
jgi:hypothetical protein